MTFKNNLILLVGCMLAFLGTEAQSTFPQNGPLDTRPNYVAIMHVNIWVDPNTFLKDATLVIKDGKIENVGINLPIGKEMRVINGHNKYVYASFIELYSNYGMANAPVNKGRGEQFVNNQKGAYAWNDAIRANLNAADYFSYDEKKSKQLLASGFGVSLSAVQDGLFRGSSVLVYTHKDHEQKLILKQKAATQLSFNKGTSPQDYPGSAMGTIALIRQTYLDATWYAQQKGEVSLSFDNFNTQKTLPAIFEAENKLAVLRAAKIGKEFGVQYLIKTAGDDYQRIEEIAQTGMPLLLPLHFPKPYEVEDPFDAANVSLGDLKHWEMAPANAAIVAQKNIPFALTSSKCADANEFLNNLRKAVLYGLSEKDALNALTLMPAKYLHLDQDLGSLQKGKTANFFISNEPIFNSGAVIEEHWVNGQQVILKASPDFHLDGNYSVKLAGYENAVLSISKDQKEVSLKGTDTLKINLHEAAGIYTLSFKANKKSEQLVRVSAWLNQVDSNNGQVKNIEGTASLGNGEKVPFSATLLSVQTEIKKADSSKAPAIGKVIYPFTEYGNEQLPKAENIIFRNATVWTNEKEGIQTQTDVAISNGKIVAIGKGLILANAKIIDATGKHLSNGIIDEHSHIAIYRGVNECTQNITAEVRIGDVVNSEDINIYRQLSGGVIGCQQLHGSCNPVGGQSSLIKLRWGMAPEQLKIANADGFIKFALGENVKQSSWSYDSGRYPQTRMGVEQVYYDAFIRAREYEAALKANPTKTRRDLELETLVEILNKKRFISCHSYVQSEINMLMHVADSMGFKVNTFTHILEGYKVADKMKAHGVSASTFADWWAYKYEVIDAIPQNAAILNKMGVVTAINSDDAEMGRRLNQEAAKIIKYGGISEEDAWKMVTLNPAKMLHLDARTGSIKVGKDADLVLWSANPLSIQAKAEMTFVDGVCYFNREQDLAARKAIQLERERIIAKMIAAKQKGEKTELKVSAPDPDYHCED
ncbi:MAG: amidohydrolase [Bacteroidetes bacterium B1(2017)]|nr:MAG: amidohydrolase [Bacteroidetes bacterium B1(2017)]